MSFPPPAAPRPALRTTTTFSIKSQSGPTSPGYPSALSPTSSVSDNGAMSPATPVERDFFTAIASKLRPSRSRSRSRSGVGRNRSKSPYQLPPEQLPSASAVAGPSSPTYPTSRSQRPRHVSTPSQSSTASAAQASRTSVQGPSRRNTSGSDPWRGRQTNSWLFNDFSITEYSKELLHLGKNSRS